jgi:dTDP-4-dehydrorhamnose 3,5-epimerase
MRRLQTQLAGLVLIDPDVHGDERGFFAETYRRDSWAQAGVDVDFVQDNHSRSRRGTLRGMHFQTVPGQAKLVRCARGEILDVAVDLRRDSPTFGCCEAVSLDDREMHQLFVPVGFAHGFCVLSEWADVTYKCSSYYVAETERTLAYDDPELAISWPREIELIVSARDTGAPRLAEIKDELAF